jgi:hypothetical protein
MAVINIDIHVEDLASVLALFDRIQVWRSVAEHGTYAEITAPSDEPAILDGSVPGPWPLNGKTLNITLNSADPIPIHFAGTDPLNLHDVCQAINSLIPALATEAGSGTNKLRLTSPVTGTGSSLIVTGDAAAVLGLSTTKTNGKSARIVVVSPTVDYLFRDFDGLATDWYETRYYSTSTHSVSSFSEPRQGSPQVVLPDATLSLAKVSLADGAGHPVVNRRIIFVPMGVQLVASGDKNYGIMAGPERVVVCTDCTGYAEIKLVRGQKFRVFFEGLAHEREFVVPNVTEFDVLQTISTTPDPFTIVQAPDLPIRVS